ncbi:L-glutamate gamma-semialdehyde dehydrogenase [Streptoalloteichus hindustanus]|uniref:L-glutamate gamma-semialdehyde dehydrogenase n=1 Tax=Streptoalloteichus hindustanus TaxID=2017 RepID=A0A1M5JZ92_STRHI|nr:L-glutamate gamma-semialdehyde dehydrogenase [Streptoalloteichus hindustanus]SHG45854.1 delta-1-pyrroline-5-carboxylate dehydrogenase [Streptoalloteichus hindustanus]
MDAVTSVPNPSNEPIHGYAPGTPERESLQKRIAELEADQHELTMTIAGERRMAGGEAIRVVQPHDHGHVLGVTAQATREDVAAAVRAAKGAAPAWRDLPFDERAAVLLRAADLLAGPWRDTLNAATILGQSKSAQQAEIDSACELIDFLRFNVHFAQRLLTEQPISTPGVWNRFDHRPLDGFVVAITPFNFTAIAGNLPLAPALMGNTVVWKPSPTQQLAAHYTMRLLEAAGLPAGVINMVTGDGAAVSEVALADQDFAGLHFTGSTKTFKLLWRTIAENLDTYRSYPRIVGETGGKDFVVVHPSADPAAVVTGLVRGAFEYQGQKCSAASRAYVPRSLWENGLREQLADTTNSIRYGDVTDFSYFGGAVIDARAFAKHRDVLERAAVDPTLEVLAGGTCDDSVGYFVQPTVLVGTDPTHEVFTTEFFGPILAVHVYEDADYSAVLDKVDGSSQYGLTGAIFATDRDAVEEAHRRLRFSAGNFYVNDKPTGAVVGQQPFGGSRASGTNDKAGSMFNLIRWTSPRSVKETFVPPTDHTYPHMG